MALFTDSPAIAVEDLASYESSILETANAEGIDLTAKIELARQEVGLQLASGIERLDGGGRDVKLTNVAVTAPLRVWMLFHTLSMVYRDAYHSQLNDRYKAKWQQYRGLSRWASEMLFQQGVGMVGDPMPEAEAPQAVASTGSLVAGTYFVRTSWVNAAGEYGAAGKLASVDLAAAGGLQVTAVNAPSRAVSWNVYAGVTPFDLYQQNTTALSPLVSWASTGALLTTSAKPGNGQDAGYLRPLPRLIQRG